MELSHYIDIRANHRYVFLSPHFDDAVYSCGGTLSTYVHSGIHPLVITIFAGIPPSNIELSSYALALYKRKYYIQDPEVMTMRRRKEDMSALDYLQVDYLHLDYLDAIYRGTPPFYTERGQIVGGEIHPADTWIAAQLFQDLSLVYARFPDLIWYAPLGVGLHVDHQIVFLAAAHLLQAGATVRFYEDFPYVMKEGELQRRLELGKSLQPTYVDISPMLQHRCEAASRYLSELPIFGSTMELYARMKEYTYSILPEKLIYVERYWEGQISCPTLNMLDERTGQAILPGKMSESGGHRDSAAVYA